MEYDFKRPELEDRDLVNHYFFQAPGRSCERTFVNVFLWSRHYKVKFAVIRDALVFRMRATDMRLRIRQENLRL